MPASRTVENRPIIRRDKSGGSSSGGGVGIESRFELAYQEQMGNIAIRQLKTGTDFDQHIDHMIVHRRRCVAMDSRPAGQGAGRLVDSGFSVRT